MKKLFFYLGTAIFVVIMFLNTNVHLSSTSSVNDSDFTLSDLLGMTNANAEGVCTWSLLTWGMTQSSYHENCYDSGGNVCGVSTECVETGNDEYCQAEICAA